MLRRQADGAAAQAPTRARQLNQEYLGVVDQLIDACRACVRVIDDPQAARRRRPGAGARALRRRRIARSRRGTSTCAIACVRNRLAKPSALPPDERPAAPRGLRALRAALAAAPATTLLALAGALAARWRRGPRGCARSRRSRPLDPGARSDAARRRRPRGAPRRRHARGRARSPTPGAPRRFVADVALGLVRAPAMISVRAVELLLYFALALGEALRARARAAARRRRAGARRRSPPRLPGAGADCSALVVFAASRVAQTVIARGLPPAAALAHGYDVTLRRFASLSRLALLGARRHCSILDRRARAAVAARRPRPRPGRALALRRARRARRPRRPPRARLIRPCRTP